MDLTYDQYMLVFYVGIIAAVLFLILAVVLLFVLKIPAVIGELSGSTQKKAIMEIRNNNGKIKPRKTSSSNTSRGKITEKMDGLTSKNGGQTAKISQNLTTAKLKGASQYLGKTEETSVLEMQSEETSVLTPESNETSVLEPETSVLVNDQTNSNVGTVIDNDSDYIGQTTVLDNGTPVLVQANPSNNVTFAVRTEITLFVSEQIIV